MQRSYKQNKTMERIGQQPEHLWPACLLLAMAVGLICGERSFAFEVKPEEVPVTPIAAPLYEKKPIQLRDCKFTAASFSPPALT